MSSVFFRNRQPADAKVGELSKEVGREAMFTVESSTEIGWHLGRDEARKSFSQEPNVIGFFCEIQIGFDPLEQYNLVETRKSRKLKPGMRAFLLLEKIEGPPSAAAKK